VVTLGPAKTVGRTAELDRLSGLLDELADGDGISVAIEGEPGIGKTRLLVDLRALADSRGHLVLNGAAAEYERDLPLAVWTDALDSYLASRDPRRMEEWDVALLETLAGVFPSLSDSRPAIGRDVADERYRVHQAVRALLQLIADDTPVVLLLDDLHWADRASIDLIAAMVRRAVAAPVLLTLSFRAGMAPEALASALAVPSLTLIDLAPLDLAGCAALIGEPPDSKRAELIYAEGGGNPFYSLQLGQSSAPVRSASGDHVADTAGVPALVAAALLEELGALGADARRLLEAAAVVGDPFEPELAYDVAELDPATGVDALDQLLDAKLLHPTAVPRRFAFRHPLVRRAVYESAKPGWRLSAHGRAATALQARGGSLLERAHHVEYSAVRGDAQAIATLVEAAEESQPRSPQGSARWYQAALRLVPAADEERRFDLVTRLAAAQRSTGDLEAARKSLLTALEMVPDEDRPTRLRLTSACAASEHFLGRHDDAQRRLHAAFDALPASDSRAGVEGLMALATGAFFTMETEPMCAFARRAVEGARGLDDKGLLFSGLALLAHAQSLWNHFAEAEDSAAEAEKLAPDLSDDVSAERLDGVNRLAWATLGLERFDDAVSHAARGMRIARRTGQDQFTPLLLSAQALAQMFLGSLPAATELATDALESARIAANDYVTCSVLTAACHVALASGDLERARQHAEESVERVDVQPGRRIPTMAAVRLAVLQREMGESCDAAALADLAGGWDLPLIPLWRSGYLEALTRRALADGDLDEAKRYAAAAEAAGTDGLALDRAYGMRASAAVRIAGGDPAAGAELALASALEADRVGARAEATRSRALAGLAQVAAGNRDEGVAVLREAELTLGELGATASRDEARRELRRLGARAETRGPVARGDTGMAALSTREREVAELVHDRKTNKVIAADLFLSEKTIESHLRNIFFKLDVSSRVEVARAVERERRIAAP
jgi:DNA-binding CsgD family transcriptional regulator